MIILALQCNVTMQCNKQSDNPILKNCAVHYNGDIIDTFSDQELLVIREQLNNNLGRELPAYSKKRHSTNNRYNYCASSEYNVELLDGVYHEDYEYLKVCNCGQKLDWSYPPDEVEE